MRKIAFYCDSLSRGGAERVTVQLSKYFSENNCICEIITSKKKDLEYDVPAGITRIILSEKHKSRWKNILPLRTVLKNKKYDAVIVMGVPDSFYVLCASIGLKTKIIISERNSPNNFEGSTTIRILSRLFLKRGDGFVFQTEDAKQFYSKITGGRGVVISNPLFVKELPEPYMGKREKHIVSLGRLDPQKNQKLLIEAFSMISEKFPDYSLIIYGEGKLRNELQSIIDNHALGKVVKLRGNINNVWEECKDAEIFVLSSNYEGMPNALIEAMAMGLICISTDCPCGGPREVIKDGENGILFRVGDVNQLAEILLEVLKTKRKYVEYGKKAISIRDRLNISVIGAKWYEYLNSIVDKRMEDM